jgi:hypothetical protein
MQAISDPKSVISLPFQTLKGLYMYPVNVFIFLTLQSDFHIHHKIMLHALDVERNKIIGITCKNMQCKDLFVTPGRAPKLRVRYDYILNIFISARKISFIWYNEHTLLLFFFIKRITLKLTCH